MIARAKELKRSERNKLNSLVRGVYLDKEGDLFGSYLLRYPTGVVTLTTALSYYSIIDSWIDVPYDLSFQIGYRPICDKNIRQFKDKKEILFLGVLQKHYEGIAFNIYDKERLLIELWRKEKYLSKDIYKQAIFYYRNLANNGNLNIPLLEQYLSFMPKSNIYLKRLSLEVL